MLKMNSELEKFYSLDEASTFFLDSAFRHIREALVMERAYSIFAEEIMKVDVPKDWGVPKLPDSLEEQLNFEGQVLPDETIEALTNCWNNSKARAIESDHIKLPKNHEVQSIEVVGHIINLHACVETVLNRYLFFLKMTGKINGEMFNSMDRAGLIPKLLYIFKDEVSTSKINIQPFRLLNRLRNNSVHFKKDSRESIKPTITELFSIWREVGLLLMSTGGDPNGNSILGYVRYVTETFLAMKNGTNETPHSTRSSDAATDE